MKSALSPLGTTCHTHTHSTMKNLTRKQIHSRRTAAAVAGAGGWVAAGMLYFDSGSEGTYEESFTSPPVDEIALMGDPRDGLGAIGDAPFDSVRKILQELSNAPGFTAAQIGFVLLDASGETLVDEGGSTALVPASTLKTVTVATALETLDPQFRFETRLLSTAPVREGALAGDLVIAGGGDPTFTRGDLTAFAADLARRGVKTVSGRIIADARHFTESSGAPVSDHWVWGDIGNAFGAAPYGLNLDHNRFTAYFTPGTEITYPAALQRTDPIVPGVVFTNDVTTGPAGSGDGVVIYSAPYARRIELRGTVPLGEAGFPVGGAVPDPPLAAAIALRDALARAGIVVRGVPTTDRLLALAGETVPPAPIGFTVHRSATLEDICRHLLGVSDNLEAECVFRSLGAGTGTDLPPAQFLRDHWAARGLGLTGLRMEDGSGLARADRIRVKDLAAIQHHVLSGAAAGVYPGLLNSGAGGRVLSKSGTMSGVRATTGYLTPASGALPSHSFALVLNAFTAPGSDADAWRDRILREILVLTSPTVE